MYVNTEVQKLKDVAITLLKNDTPVWFGESFFWSSRVSRVCADDLFGCRL
jgi:aminopeptidase C